MQVFTPDGSIVDGEILDHKNGTYEFVYTVPKEGNFSLALRLYDQHIKGSPFKLTVTKASEVEVEVGRLTRVNLYNVRSAVYRTFVTLIEYVFLYVQINIKENIEKLFSLLYDAQKFNPYFQPIIHETY